MNVSILAALGHRGAGAMLLLLGGIIPLLILGLVTYGLVTLWRGRAGDVVPVGVASASPSAQLILDERFARGEVDADTYRVHSEILRTSGRVVEPTPAVEPTLPVAPVTAETPVAPEVNVDEGPTTGA